MNSFVSKLIKLHNLNIFTRALKYYFLINVTDDVNQIYAVLLIKPVPAWT